MSKNYIERHEFKALFRNYSGLNNNIKHYLVKNGFEIYDGKKHWKILYIPTKQMFVISKTPSDFRTGRNFASVVLNSISS